MAMAYSTADRTEGRGGVGTMAHKYSICCESLPLRWWRSEMFNSKAMNKSCIGCWYAQIHYYSPACLLRMTMNSWHWRENCHTTGQIRHIKGIFVSDLIMVWVSLPLDTWMCKFNFHLRCPWRPDRKAAVVVPLRLSFSMAICASHFMYAPMQLEYLHKNILMLKMWVHYGSTIVKVSSTAFHCLLYAAAELQGVGEPPLSVSSSQMLKWMGRRRS